MEKYMVTEIEIFKKSRTSFLFNKESIFHEGGQIARNIHLY